MEKLRNLVLSLSLNEVEQKQKKVAKDENIVKIYGI